ncbi:AraC family transcriptional regulator [Microtetraspora sp. NBRC 13810]|uniref:AraC-like ligand-binding domain-containing protein n=1 Tax=Microtetraspora sp. NBRC 13810 TaxID=3030990 RepID=UPI0024A03F30|nr:helix-turn-helix domain-containing protein [Microtetraspora sp. NBRC 13810]GLW10716.1 AraC family transcriptional regulator [Microtetraspora sp. NBRC 13810]
MAIETIFRSNNLPAPQRYDSWCELTAKTLFPTIIASEYTSAFQAELGMADLGPVQVTAMTHSPLTTRRPPHLIRRSDPEMYLLAMFRRGSARFSQADRHLAATEHDLLLFDTSRPFVSETHAQESACAEVIVHVPRTLLPPPLNSAVNGITPALLPADVGIGGLLSGVLQHLITDTGPLRPADTVRIGGIVLDLLTSLLAHEVEADAHIPPETRAATLDVQIHAFIERHLDDPLLSSSMIADAHHVSVRYVQRIFQRRVQTISDWVRERRLDRCRRDLADPALASRPVHAIAARWGLPHPQHFSRAFRKAYGMAPQDYRRMVLYNVSQEPINQK